MKTMSESTTAKESGTGNGSAAGTTGYRIALVPGALEVSARLASNDELDILVKVLEANTGSLGKLPRELLRRPCRARTRSRTDAFRLCSIDCEGWWWSRPGSNR